MLFAVYTSKPPEPGQEKPHAGTIAALTGALAQCGISIKDGLLVGDDSCLPYDDRHLNSPSIPLSATQSSEINAEFVYRGSQIETNAINLPASTKETLTADAVLDRMEDIRGLPSHKALDQARNLWASNAGGEGLSNCRGNRQLDRELPVPGHPRSTYGRHSRNRRTLDPGPTWPDSKQTTMVQG